MDVEIFPLALLATHLASTVLGAVVVVAPMSMNVTLGEEVTFYCAAEDAFLITWTINDVSTDFLPVEPTLKQVDGVLWSNLTLAGTVENNNSSIQCWLVSWGTKPLFLPVVFLSVLGIGPVSSLTLSLLTCIEWEEPAFISSDIMHLMYNVVLSGANLPPLNATTHDTQYCTEFTPCQEYTVAVTPFSTSPDHVGISTAITNTTPGDSYHLQGSCITEIIFAGADNVTCSFACEIERPPVACPLQCLHMLTNVVTDHSSESSPLVSSVLFTDEEDLIVISVGGLHPGEKYYSNFSIVNGAGIVVDTGTTHFFSTYSVQSAKISYLTNTTNSVDVTCFFAINAPASGCLALFENSLIGLSFNGTVPHSPGSLISSGVVGIPQEIIHQEPVQGMKGVLFDVKVFDVSGSGKLENWPAFEQKGALKLGLGDVKIDVIVPTTHTIGMPLILSTKPSPSSTNFSPLVSSVQDSKLLLTAVVSGSLVAVMLLLVVSLLVAVLCCYKQRKGISEHMLEPGTNSVPITALVMDVSMESKTAAQTSSNVVCSKCIAYEDVPQKVNTPETSDTTLDVVCFKSPAYAAVSCKSPIYDYISVNDVCPKSPLGVSHYMELGSCPLDAPPILPALGGKKVLYSDVNHVTTTSMQNQK